MKLSKWIIAILLIFLMSCSSKSIQETSPFNGQALSSTASSTKKKFPESTAYVNDFENIFTKDQRQNLEKKIAEYEFRTTRQIAVVSISSIEPYSNMRDFAMDLLNEWGVGQKETNNGLLIVFSKARREVRISTGLGTEGILTDAICKDVIDRIFIPAVKEENYYEGMDKMIAELIAKWH